MVSTASRQHAIRELRCVPHQIDWPSATFAHVRFSGFIRLPDLAAATDALYNDARFEALQHVVWDFSAIAGFALDERAAVTMAYTDRVAAASKPLLRSAFVTRDPALFLLTERYIDTLARLDAGWHNRVFTDLGRACVWLQVEQP